MNIFGGPKFCFQIHLKGSPSLIINNAIKADEGKYVCIAANLVGSGQSQQTYLTVVGSK
jgi:hypothetical protein